MDYACPICKQPDMVQKVSALVSNETFTGSYSNTDGKPLLSAFTLSKQAAQLAPPSPPPLEGAWGSPSRIFVVLGLLFSCVTFLSALTLITTSNWNQVSRDLITATIIFAVVFTFAIIKDIRAQQGKAKYKANMYLYKRAIAIWNKLYYCHRNDIVFLPDDPKSCVPTFQISRLLW